jgi:hypothetical protein
MPDWRAAELVKSPEQLPLVDPDFLLVERRAETLHAYARALLRHLRHIRAGGKAGGYPIATIKAAAVWLIESYSEAPQIWLERINQPLSRLTRPIDRQIQTAGNASADGLAVDAEVPGDCRDR